MPNLEERYFKKNQNHEDIKSNKYLDEKAKLFHVWSESAETSPVWRSYCNHCQYRNSCFSAAVNNAKLPIGSFFVFIPYKQSIMKSFRITLSELINGVNPFTLNDLILMHKLLNIDLAVLITTTLNTQVIGRVLNAVLRLNNPKFKVEKRDLVEA